MGLLFFLLPFLLSAGPLEKGFDALKVFNYFEAREYFTKSLKNHPAGGAYGLSIIFYRNDNPFHQVDSAYKYILLSERSFKTSDPKEKEDLQKLSVTLPAIDEQKQKIIQLAFERTKKENTVELFTRFIKGYAPSPLVKEAKKLRSKLAFENAKKANTLQAYKDFVSAYPDAEEINDARWLYDFSLFKAVTQPNKIENYEAFIKQYPKSQYKWQAEDSIYAYYTKHETAIEYHSFIKKNPLNHNVKKAWENIYVLAAPDGAASEIAAFAKSYPDFPDPTRLKNDALRSKINLYPILQDGKYGFIDSLGKIIIPCTYDWVDGFSAGTAVVMTDDQAGFINKEGKVILPLFYEEANPFYKGLAIVKMNGKYGLVHKTGRQVLPFEFEDISWNNKQDEIIVALKLGVYYFYSLSGKILFEGKFEKAGDFNSGKAYIIKDGKYGFIDSKGKPTIPAVYDWAENFSASSAAAPVIARVKQNDKFGLIDTSGKLLLPCEYTSIDEFSEGMAVIVKEKKFGFADESGKIVIPIKFDYSPEISAAKGFQNGMAKAEQNKKRGLIDRTGKFIVPCEFDDIRAYSHELCAVKKGKWGYIDKNKKQKISCQFDYAWDFAPSIPSGSGGLARVKIKGKTGFINTKGELIMLPAYDEATDLVNNISITTLLGKKGVLDASGKLIIPCEMDEITRVGTGVIKLEKNSKTAYYNLPLQKQVWAETGF